ncbi:MAG: N-acetylmuramoyl-L-alanine amidase, partial [Planctomycetes bacterium]|nr:N-acetylmuramoyl-L-alanine amidase [Planctomycetota bacterium]
AVTVLALAAGCRGPQRVQRGSSRGGPLDAESIQAEILKLETAAAVATDPAEKAWAHVRAGRAHLAAGGAKKALGHFYEARRLQYDGGVASETNRGIGEAYFELGDHALARRYLLKGLDGAQAPERERALALLVVCSRALDDVEGAVAFREKLPRPLSPETESILGREPRRAADGADGPAEAAGAPEEDPGPLPPPPGRSPDAGRAPEGDGFVYLSRESWQARSPRRNIEPMGRVDKVTVHHTGGDSFWSRSRAEAADEIRRIQRYHQSQQGWADIGYHYVIDPSGTVWQGRKLRYQGAHARGAANSGNVGIVLLGNFTQQPIPPAQRRSLELLVEKLCEYFSIPAHRVYTHREITGGGTDCPGPALSRVVTDLRAELRRRLVAYRP